MRTNMLNALNMWFNLRVAFATDVDRHSGDIKHMPIHTTMYSRQNGLRSW